jgi:serine/threonine protein kinase
VDRWQEVERVFLAAAELAPAERAVFVERETRGDSELRAAVEGMLRHSGAGGTLFQETVQHAASVVVEPELPRIDGYAILREIGRGGMGAVYLAERTREDFRRQVAIKVVKHGMDTAHIVDRLRQERRILASLDHPNIARLLDGGATTTGQPYIVMELIEGQPLMDYCREMVLPLRDRLRLFEQICAAVRHAHQKLVVHRDIKPANIRVTPAGIPKLLDFGIAKLLMSDENDAAPHTLTMAGLRLLTPDYASPEQVRGDPVTVASDVYSLGAVLYELLTGKRAHELANYTELELARVICETEVKPPSATVEGVRAKRELAGDLDNIVCLALRKDPARRYASVEQLAADIRNYLEGRPVLARRENVLYRARKFVTRNRMSVAMAALVVISLVAGMIGTTLQARRADAEAAQARRRFDQVRKLARTFVYDIYDGMDAIAGTAQLRATVVSTALEYLDSLAKEAEGDTALQLELAAAYKRIGDVQGNPSRSSLGDMSAALASYEKAALVLNRVAERDPRPEVLTDLANIERTISNVILDADHSGRALEHLRRSIATWERHTPTRGQNLQADTGIAQAWGTMGKVYTELGDAPEAVRLHTSAVGLMRSWLPRETLETTRGTISLMLTDLGRALRDIGDLQGAVDRYHEAAQIRKQIMQKNPKNITWRRRLFVLNWDLALVYGSPLDLSLSNREAAERYATDALREAESMVAEDKGSSRANRDRWLATWLLGAVLIPYEPSRALQYSASALELASALPRAGSDPFPVQAEADSQETLALALLKTGDRQRAVTLLRRSAEGMERLSREAPQIIDYRSELIRILHALGDALPPVAAAEHYRKAYLAAEDFPNGDRNMYGALRRAEANLRWPRWNTAAPAAERRKRLEAALRAFERMAGQAPANRSIQAALAEARRGLADI